jgi:hypothetical protein
MTRSYFPSWRAAVAKVRALLTVGLVLQVVQGRLGRLAVSPAEKQCASNDSMHLLISDRQVLFQTEFPVSLGVGEQRTD